MKTLVIFAVILGILFLYFVIKGETSVVTKGNEVMPGGIDIPKLLLDKAAEIKSQAADNDIINAGSALISKIKSDAEDLLPNAINKISESVKNPIENKINEALCPQK